MNDSPQPRPPLLPKLLLALALVVVAGVGILYLVNSGYVAADVDMPRLVGLLAILAFVGVGVLARPIGAGQILRSIVLWAAIFLVAAGLYASRDELAGFAGRLLGAIAPGVPISGRLAGDIGADSVSFIRSGNGHFAVHTVVNQTPVTMLFDTGASFVTLTARDAGRAGFDPDSLSYTLPIRTANGTMTAATVTLERLKVGPIEHANVRALVAPHGSLEQSLLGLSFLDRLDGYAISGDRLVLTP